MTSSRCLLCLSTVLVVGGCEKSAMDVDERGVSQDDGSRDASDESSSGGSDAAVTPFELPIPPSEPFASHEPYPNCIHPGVEQDCADGWCRIPAGCFIWGSPESEPHRGAANEEQGPVTLTRAFEMMQFEVTIEEWESHGFETTLYPYTNCTAPDCPISRRSWFHVLPAELTS